MELLRVEGISKTFGGVVAVNNFSMVQGKEEITAIIGPNGAGKTTIFNLITAVTDLDAGRIWFDGQDVTRLPSHKRTRLGMTRTFQNIRLFNDLRVLDNLKAAYGMRLGYSSWEEMAKLPRVRSQEREAEDVCRHYLAYFGLEQYAAMKPNNLPYGLQRRLELARALVCDPKLLLLDEPAAGLNPKETRDLMETILKIHGEKRLSVLLVEHHMELVMNISHTIHVLDFGKKIAEGPPEEIKKNPDVLKAYLGDEG